MCTFSSRNFKRIFLSAALLSVSRLAVAQFTADAPAAVITGTCKGIEFNRALLSSAVKVDLLATVDTSGKAVSVIPLTEVANPPLVAAVVSSVMTCTFLPAIREGRATSGVARLVYQFSPAVAAAPLSTGRRPMIADVQSCAPTAEDYPRASRQLNETGTTRVNFTVSPEGRLTAFGVVRSSGFLRLDFTALIKLAGCRFQPGTAPDGTPTSASFDVDYVWKLE